MARIRLIVQASATDADARVKDLVTYTAALRDESGCLQSEDFRGSEFGENLLHLELWEDAAAFDAHWHGAMKAGASAMLAELMELQAPYHFGTVQAPRRHGQNGIEFYEHRYFMRDEGLWSRADEAERSSAVRWPAWGPIRIVVQGTGDPSADLSEMIKTSEETREEEGCLQFEHFRSLEFPENTVYLEHWASPEAFDLHWMNRTIQRSAGGARLAGGGARVERRYGQPGFEWYNHSFYTLINGIWHPEEPARRMSTVHW